jgi:hypothetical protein
MVRMSRPPVVVVRIDRSGYRRNILRVRVTTAVDWRHRVAHPIGTVTRDVVLLIDRFWDRVVVIMMYVVTAMAISPAIHWVLSFGLLATQREHQYANCHIQNVSHLMHSSQESLNQDAKQTNCIAPF